MMVSSLALPEGYSREDDDLPTLILSTEATRLYDRSCAETNCAYNEACLSRRTRRSRQPDYVGPVPVPHRLSAVEGAHNENRFPLNAGERFTMQCWRLRARRQNQEV